MQPELRIVEQGWKFSVILEKGKNESARIMTGPFPTRDMAKKSMLEISRMTGYRIKTNKRKKRSTLSNKDLGIDLGQTDKNIS